MTVTPIQAKTLLRVQKKIDSWFLSRAGMNFYRGCAHDCVYCDGRAEKYNVSGEFASDIGVKTNAIELLERELAKMAARGIEDGFFVIGGGVGDAYQPLEEEYQLARKALQIFCKRSLPVHVLTKSTLILRDIDILTDINAKKRAVVSASFSSGNDGISAHFEPGVPPPSKRLAMLEEVKKRGLSVGIYLMPLLPAITDSQEMIEDVFSRAKDIGVDFIMAGGLTLKDGRQREYFDKTIHDMYPHTEEEYRSLYHGDASYRGNAYGQAYGGYYASLNTRILTAAQKYRMPIRMPRSVWPPLSINSRVILMLEHIDFYLQCAGKRPSYVYAAHAVGALKESLRELTDVSAVNNVSEDAARVIREILDTGTSALYERLSGLGGVT
ncbi:MAG: radical SAM protein [Spirochaetota bacterium]